MRVFVMAPNIDGTDVGEAYVAFKWVEALSHRVDLTIASFERPGRKSLAQQLPNARVVSWPEPRIARVHERLNAMAKPAWPVFAARVHRFLRQEIRAERCFDLAHQLMPQAARYASPLRHFDIPYIIGPLGGALETPGAFRHEAGSAPLFTRLRALDAWRFRNDRALRASYSGAAAVLGVAPYVKDILADVPLKRFEAILELGIEELAPDVVRRPVEGQLRLLHVGRGVRTKGLRDAVRALARLKNHPGITLTSAGAGEEIEICRRDAERLGVADRVTFLGRIPRADVEELYRSHDVFCFPSFREPAGGVLYEAMRWGLPVITAARGGPDWIVDGTCGVRIPVTTPDTFANDIAEGVLKLAQNIELRQSLGAGARVKVEREGLWSEKADNLIRLYQELIGSKKVYIGEQKVSSLTMRA